MNHMVSVKFEFNLSVSKTKPIIDMSGYANKVTE